MVEIEGDWNWMAAPVYLLLRRRRRISTIEKQGEWKERLRATWNGKKQRTPLVGGARSYQGSKVGVREALQMSLESGN